MVEFSDILYGSISLPDWLIPFIKLPEFVRLRGVRLSNVDSYQFKDFGGPTRWEHCLAVAALALKCAERRGLGDREKAHLILAGLLHDVATPPFAHTGEYVLESFDHELESQRLLSLVPGTDFQPDVPVFASQLPQFHRACRSLSNEMGIRVDPEEVAKIVVGEGDLGFLMHGIIDLDNADNVLRACLYMGINVDRAVPIRIAEWLADQPSIPTGIEGVSEPSVAAWREYRRTLYSRFYLSSDEELGRQAFLQHLMRRAARAGMPRSSIVWNTDERLLAAIESFDEEDPGDYTPLRELVQRYRLLEAPYKIAAVEIDSKDALRALRAPQSVAWIEEHLSSPGFEPFVMVSPRRYVPEGGQASLFPSAAGSILIFKLGRTLKREQLPEWLREAMPAHVNGPKRLTGWMTQALHDACSAWVEEKPWMKLTRSRRSNILSSLGSVGDWSFRLSRNDSIHPYPSNFVHAIPASFIVALGLQNELIVDPFGGTGATAAEAVKYGGQAVTADSNTLATLVARVRLTFLPHGTRRWLRTLTADDVLSGSPSEPPEIEMRDKWYHPNTFEELVRIRGFILGRSRGVKRDFLDVCFSAILPDCTARRGKQHGYFADKAPLPKGMSSPPYQNAAALFINRVRRNVDAMDRYNAFFERDERDPSRELQRARCRHLDARTSVPADYGIPGGSAAAIITSPPYLCMADYSLGLRLSYPWIAPEALKQDFDREIGSRRTRFSPERAVESYLGDMGRFAKLAAGLLRRNGFFATVLAAPVAVAFKDLDLITKIDRIFASEGFELLWHRWRPIHWHRNHGYERLKQERVAVHVLRT